MGRMDGGQQEENTVRDENDFIFDLANFFDLLARFDSEDKLKYVRENQLVVVPSGTAPVGFPTEDAGVVSGCRFRFPVGNKEE